MQMGITTMNAEISAPELGGCLVVISCQIDAHYVDGDAILNVSAAASETVLCEGNVEEAAFTCGRDFGDGAFVGYTREAVRFSDRDAYAKIKSDYLELADDVEAAFRDADPAITHILKDGSTVDIRDATFLRVFNWFETANDIRETLKHNASVA